jgi:hypothetical protein
VDSEKPDVQASWETAIARKHTKKPAVTTSNPPAATTTVKNTDAKPSPTEAKHMGNTPQVPVENMSHTVAGLGTEQQGTPVLSPDNALMAPIAVMTDEEKMRQMLLLNVLKKYSPKKELQKSPRQASDPQEIAKLIRKKKKKLGQKQQQQQQQLEASGSPIKKKLKKKKQLRSNKLSTSSMLLSQQQQQLAMNNSCTEDISTELLSICMESNIETPANNSAESSAPACLLRIPAVMPPPYGRPMPAEADESAQLRPNNDHEAVDGSGSAIDGEPARLVVDERAEADPDAPAVSPSPKEEFPREKSSNENAAKEIVTSSEGTMGEPSLEMESACADGHHCAPRSSDSELQASNFSDALAPVIPSVPVLSSDKTEEQGTENKATGEDTHKDMATDERKDNVLDVKETVDVKDRPQDDNICPEDAQKDAVGKTGKDKNDRVEGNIMKDSDTDVTNGDVKGLVKCTAQDLDSDKGATKEKDKHAKEATRTDANKDARKGVQDDVEKRKGKCIGKDLSKDLDKCAKKEKDKKAEAASRTGTETQKEAGKSVKNEGKGTGEDLGDYLDKNVEKVKDEQVKEATRKDAKKDTGKGENKNMNTVRDRPKESSRDTRKDIAKGVKNSIGIDIGNDKCIENRENACKALIAEAQPSVNEKVSEMNSCSEENIRAGKEEDKSEHSGVSEAKFDMSDMSAANVDGCAEPERLLPPPPPLLAPGHVDDKTFCYVDPVFPAGWSVMVKLRNSDVAASSIKSDSYYYTPCGARLRSRAEIVKFLRGKLVPSTRSHRPPLPLAVMPQKSELRPEDLQLTTVVEKELFEVRPASPVEATVDKVEQKAEESKHKVDAATGAVVARPDVLREKKEPSNNHLSGSPVKTRSACSLATSRAAALKKKAVLAITKKTRKLLRESDDVTIMAAVPVKKSEGCCGATPGEENLFKVPTLENLRMLRSKQGPKAALSMKRKVLPAQPVVGRPSEQDHKVEEEKGEGVDNIKPEEKRKVKKNLLVLSDEAPKSSKKSIIEEETKKTENTSPTRTTRANSDLEKSASKSSHNHTVVDSSSELNDAKSELTVSSSQSDSDVIEVISPVPAGAENADKSSQDGRDEGDASVSRRLTRSNSETGATDVIVEKLTPPTRASTRQTRASLGELEQQQQLPALPSDSGSILKHDADNLTVGEKANERKIEDGPVEAIKIKEEEEEKVDKAAVKPGRGRPPKRKRASQAVANNEDNSTETSTNNKAPLAAVVVAPAPTTGLKEEEDEVEVIIEVSPKRRRLLGPASRRAKRPRSTDSESDETGADMMKRLKSEEAVAENSRISEPNDIIRGAKEEAAELPHMLRSLLRCQLLLVNTFQRQLGQLACAHCASAGALRAESLVIDMAGGAMAAECAHCRWTTVRKISVASREEKDAL